MKQPVSFRLTPEALALLRRLSEVLGISQANAMELALRQFAKREGVSVGKEK